MTEEELHTLIKKFRYLSTRNEPNMEEKSIVYERFAEFLENFSGNSGLSEFDIEENLWDYFKEVETENDNYWDVAFPEEIEEDEIEDGLTKN